MDVERAGFAERNNSRIEPMNEGPQREEIKVTGILANLQSGHGCTTVPVARWISSFGFGRRWKDFYSGRQGDVPARCSPRRDRGFIPPESGARWRAGCNRQLLPGALHDHLPTMAGRTGEGNRR